ncbi:Fet3 protein [Lanmaoa asiatica]|nr:Fet3 protein [Lanmaoa asiatica]
MFGSFFYLLPCATIALAGVQELWWNVTYVQDADPDGLFARRVIGVNNSWPPPPLSVNTSDSLLLHVTNSLDVPTTLHHHGMFFNSTSWMDGAGQVSQCGIPPGQTFDYIVPINSSGQHGTFWAHAHAYGQYVDGFRAPLVLHPSNETYQYDEEFTVILGDWYHQEHAALIQSFITISNPSGIEPVPSKLYYSVSPFDGPCHCLGSGLIYFSQNSSYLPPIAGSSPAPVTSAVGFNENTTLPFVPGRTYRLRIINMAAFTAFYFWIDGHEMRIIEADGTDVQEYPTDMLSISAAQRYSMLVQARNDSSSNWMIHANMDTTMFDKVPTTLQTSLHSSQFVRIYRLRCTQTDLTSSITYAEGQNITDLGPVQNYYMTNDTALVPVDPIPQPVASQSVELEVVFQTMDDGTNRGTLNGYVYNSPIVPAIMSVLTLGENATAQEAYGPYSIMLDHLDVVDIVVKNGDKGSHPFHLHGHKFQIVNRAQQYNSTDPTLNPPLIEGQANPMRRDTITIPGGSSATLRVVADNPGAWLFHCHIEWHLEAGLAVQFIEAPLQVQERAAGQVPPSLYEQCAALGIPQSGNAAGRASATDLTGLPLGPWPQIMGWLPKGILAMTGCVLTAVVGMSTVVWYMTGVTDSEEEIEQEVIRRIEAKRSRKRFGLFKKTQ